MAKDYPVGKAQKMVLDALGMSASGFSDAERIFDELGITVASVRRGRSSVPQVTIHNFTGGFTAAGDGEATKIERDVDLSVLDKWVA